MALPTSASLLALPVCAFRLVLRPGFAPPGHAHAPAGDAEDGAVDGHGAGCGAGGGCGAGAGGAPRRPVMVSERLVLRLLNLYLVTAAVAVWVVAYGIGRAMGGTGWGAPPPLEVALVAAVVGLDWRVVGWCGPGCGQAGGGWGRRRPGMSP